MTERAKRTVEVWNKCECGRTLVSLGEALRGSCASCWCKAMPADTKTAMNKLLAAFSPTTSQTIEEIERLLVRAGARGITKDYNADGQVTSLSFTIPNPETKLPMGIQLPASPDAVFEVFKQGKGRLQKRSEDAGTAG